MGRPDLPNGTVTFLFTDVEGSTRMLHALGEEKYAEVLAEHRRILRSAVDRYGGIEVDTEGDAIFAAFPTALDALSAAREAQAGLGTIGVKVRMGLHTGTPLRTEEGYVGMDVHRAARIAAAGHGGQVLLSSTTAALVGGATEVPLTDLGEHRLKDLAAAERLFQIGAEEHPALKTLSPSNLPEPIGSFIGREAELRQLGGHLADAAIRLLTVVGPGGLGKTRLALEAAARTTSQFPDGRWWLSLAAVHDPARVTALVAESLGLPDDAGAGGIARHLMDRRILLVLDNAEHLLPALSPIIADLLPTSGRSVALVTSREPLKLAAEHVVRIPVLSEDDAESLLISRAAALGATIGPSQALRSLVSRLDRLPLALQLAASRLPLLTVEQILERISQRLDLFTGPVDADPRQRTLRATIEWSHDLLSEPERTLFRRLAAFEGGCTLEAAEAVAGARLDTLQALIDRSMVEREDEPGFAAPRFRMLDSIGQYALERLADSGEEEDVRARHAAWFRDLAERVDEQLRAGEPEERWVGLLNPELDNLRAAFARGLKTGDAQLVRSVAASLPMFWAMRGHVAEGRTWIEQALEIDPTEDIVRRRLYSGLAILAYHQGDYAAATEAGDLAAELSIRLGPAEGRYAGLREKARAALGHGDLATAESLYEEALVAARDDDNGVGMSSCRINLAYIANRTGRHQRAQELLAENLPFVRSRGQARCEATSLVSLAETLNYLERPAEAVDYAVAAAEVAPRAADPLLLVENMRWYALAAARLGEHERTARLLGVCEQAEGEMDAPLEPFEEELRTELLTALRHTLTETQLDEERSHGRSLGLAAANALVAPIRRPSAAP
jgi:predicted ATPase/class 3 adenylate cyclase